jgi:hypothetical protein
MISNMPYLVEERIGSLSDGRPLFIDQGLYKEKYDAVEAAAKLSEGRIVKVDGVRMLDGTETEGF